MSDLEQVLRSSLEKATVRFAQAKRDLNDAVASLKEDVMKITKGRASLSLEEVEEQEAFSRFVLCLVPGKMPLEMEALGRVVLYGFTIPTLGYPIAVHARLATIVNFGGNPIASPADRQALQAFFREIAANPDSVLVTSLAHYLRRMDK